MTHKPKKYDYFSYLVTLTSVFLLFEISFFIQSNHAYLADFTFVTSNFYIPKGIWPGVIFFISAQLVVHFAYCALIAFVTFCINDLLKLSSTRALILALIIWVIGIVTVLVANQYFFPNSKFSGLTQLILFNNFLLKITFFCLCLLCGFFALLALISILQYSLFRLSLAIIGILAIGIFYLPSLFPTAIKDAATKEKPNIIIIGVDAVRPDFLSYFGHDKSTPFFDEFLNSATVFSEAITPLARTFPSWTSILMGQYPIQNGIRSDLVSQKNKDFSASIANILRQRGYETVFSIDETRFSNIDKNFGFDQVITPPMGFNDFLLGTFNDFPLSNLLVNTKIGQWLFPYSYANRPVYFTYEPDSFLQLVKPVLQQNRTKPLFLAIHFCLPHSPYLWASLSADGLSAVERYQATIIRADKQLKDFFNLLRTNNLLNHAIVVLLSDHGEALELPGDRITEKELFMNKIEKHIPIFYPPVLDNESLNESAGHGSDVLGLPQYHSVLAFKLYGLQSQKMGTVSGPVSLVDIKATLLDLVHMQSNASNSLANIILGKQEKILPHPVFLESDFSPEAVRTVYPQMRTVLLEGIKYFQVDPVTLRITVKDDMMHMILRSKQYAEINGDWMLALYPQENQEQIYILVNLRTGEWTDNLNSPFAKQSPALSMLKRLQSFKLSPAYIVNS